MAAITHSCWHDDTSPASGHFRPSKIFVQTVKSFHEWERVHDSAFPSNSAVSLPSPLGRRHLSPKKIKSSFRQPVVSSRFSGLNTTLNESNRSKQTSSISAVADESPKNPQENWFHAFTMSLVVRWIFVIGGWILSPARNWRGDAISDHQTIGRSTADVHEQQCQPIAKQNNRSKHTASL